MDNKYNWKVISVSGCKMIGRGGKADVYLLDEEKVVKVFHDELSADQVESELRRSQAVYESGLPAVRVYEAVVAGDRYGIVSEYIHGSSLGAVISGSPDRIGAYGKSMGELFRKLHSTRAGNDVLTDIKERTALWTDYLEEHFITHDDALKIREILDCVPDTGTLLHCDFHPGNIMLRGEEPVMIDLDDICTGHPIFDLTFNSLLHKFSPPGMIEQAMSMSTELANEFRKTMLSAYFETDDKDVLDGYEHYIDLFGMMFLPLIMAKSAIAWNVTEEQARAAVAAAMPGFRENAQKIKEAASHFPQHVR